MNMKTFLIVMPFLLLSQVASADTASECSPIKKSSARLACYDKAAAPSKTDSSTAKPKVVNAADPFSAEDTRTTARLKGICRQC
jgi:hypothetical protein